MTTKPNLQLSARDIYKTFWQCRDFELRSFWQRATLLGTFMALTYTGYGALWVAFLTTETSWKGFNLLATGLACQGMIMSALWILLSKASKAWYEWYETALSVFQANNPQGAIPKQLEGYASFAIGDVEGFRTRLPDTDEHYSSENAGPFSPSKITIVLGRLSLSGWSGVALAHSIALLVGIEEATRLFENYAPHAAFGMILLTTVLVIGGLRKRVKSGALEANK